MSDIGVRVFTKSMLVKTRDGDDPRPYKVRLELDIDVLMRMLAPKARRNRSRRSRYLAGAVVCCLVPP